MVEALLFSDYHFDAEDSPFVMFVRSAPAGAGLRFRIQHT